MAQVGLDDVAACFSKISRNWCRVISRSPVAIGTLTARRTSASASMFSGGTGSSQKYGRNSAMAWMNSMATAGQCGRGSRS